MSDCDGRQPALQSAVNVTLRVLDSNDNEPVFERQRYELHLPGWHDAVRR